MNILILGGTGAMGAPLVQLLGKDNRVAVTSRSKKQSKVNITYIQGNAKEDMFIKGLLRGNYEVIIDFMIYGTEQFKERLNLFLDNCKQYFYFSSSRVYADSNGQPITEDSPRLLDICTDEEYLKTDEYALAKAREEDLLRNSGSNNWTIIRPYITYNAYRLQLGVYEKENWLYRALKGRTIVLPKDIADSITSLTYGLDVAKAICKLIGNEQALGQAFHIVTKQSATWKEILDIYVDVIERETGKRPKVKFVDNSEYLQTIWNKYQIKYDRLFDRKFDSSKLTTVTGFDDFTEFKQGLTVCLKDFLKNPQWRAINWKFEAWADKQAGERTKLKEIKGIKTKVKYLIWRYFQ